MNWFWAENEVVDVFHFSVTACCRHILCWEGQRFLSWTCRRLAAAGCGGGRKHLLLDGSFSLIMMSVFQPLTGWEILKNWERRRNFFLRTLLVNLRQWNISLWGIGIWWKVNWCSCRNLKLATELSFLCHISLFFFLCLNSQTSGKVRYLLWGIQWFFRLCKYYYQGKEVCTAARNIVDGGKTCRWIGLP